MAFNHVDHGLEYSHPTTQRKCNPSRKDKHHPETSMSRQHPRPNVGMVVSFPDNLTVHHKL